MEEDDVLPMMLFNVLADECSVQSAASVSAELVTGASVLEETFVSACYVPRKLTKKNERVKSYYEDVIPEMTVDTVKSHFRMSRRSMEELCKECAPHLQSQHKYERMPVEKKVLMAVWGLANQDVYRKVGNLFDTNRGAAQKCMMEACCAIAVHLKPVYIRLPTVPQCTTIADETEQKHGFPGVCGFIDGTHIPVKPPSWDRDSYINRKGFPSVNVLAVCDHKMRFTYVYADRAGSVHDARVLRVSALGQMLESNSWPSGDNMHVLGDSAYPLLSNLLVPYRDNGYLTDSQRRFNAVHSSTRSVVERAFGRLKGKFRRMKGIDATLMCNALMMIEAAFVLHNFILEHEDDGGESEDDDEYCDDVTQDSSLRVGNAAAKLHARQKRDRIASLL